MPWVPIHTSGLDYNLQSEGMGVSVVDSNVYSIPDETTFANWSLTVAGLLDNLQVRVTWASYDANTGGLDHNGYFQWSAPGETLEQQNDDINLPTTYFEPNPVLMTIRPSPGSLSFYGPGHEEPATEVNYEALVEVFIEDEGPGDTCFWDGLVMAAEDCTGGDVDPPDDDRLPVFGRHGPTSSPGMIIERDHFCDEDLYAYAATGGTDLLLTHMVARGGPGSGFGWFCGDGEEPQPAWVALGEPLYFTRYLDGEDNPYWSLPWEVLDNALGGKYYGYVAARIENGEDSQTIEGVAFASPGF